MSEQALDAPSIELPVDRTSRARPRPAVSVRELLRRYPWVLGAIALLG